MARKLLSLFTISKLSACKSVLNSLRPGCIKRCQVVVKINIISSDLIGGYLTFYLNQPIKWADFRLDALLADTMLTLYTTGPKCFLRIEIVSMF
jgi:hypothetical protein